MASQTNEEVASLLQAAGALVTEERFAKAVETVRKAIKLEPDCAPAYFQWGVILENEKKYESAIGKYRRAAELDPTHAQARHGWGNCLAYLEKYADAIEQYRQAAELAPDDAYIQNDWGAALANSGHSAEAAEKYRRATELKPDYGAAYGNWGRRLSALGDEAGAVEKFRRAVELGEKSAHESWGYSLANLGRYEEAIEQYRLAAEVVPNSAGLIASWGGALSNLRRYDEAIAMYEKALAIDPNHPLPHYNWGVTLGAQSKFGEAIEKYRRAAEIDPTDADIFNGWGVALAGQRQFDDAIAQYRHAAELDPKHEFVHRNWGLALAGQRKYDEATEQFRKAVAIDPKSADAYLDWGDALANQGRYREAIAVTRCITEFDRDNPYAYHNIAYFRWKKGDYKASWRSWDEAIDAYRKMRTAKRKEGDADFFSNYGGVLHEQIGNLKQAEEVLLEGLAIDPNHADILARLGELYTDRYRDPGRERDENWSASFWEARHYYDRAEQQLRRRVASNADVASLRKLGELLILTESYDEARAHLERAYQIDPDGALSNSLGVVCSRLEDYHRAAEYYATALKHSPGDLAFWSNLAETYLKLDKRDRAEKEYRKILAIAEDHIDSQVGLGEVYTAMADAGDSELYEVALRHYSRAISLAQNGTGSKLVARKEIATMYYARGYAAVQAYEAQGTLGGEKFLTHALNDFKSCVENDPEHYKGDRAKQKIVDRRKVFTADWVTRKGAPLLIVFSALVILAEAQMAHYQIVKGLEKIQVGEYSALTFGALMFIVIGLFLPQIQKLKGAGIELEKSPVNQITTSAGLGIKK